MRWLGPVAATVASAVVVVFAFCAWAVDDKDRPFGGPPPQRNTEERPFGGPPPSNRDLTFRKTGKTCKTATSSCQLEKGLAVGTACSCAGAGASPGAEGKVERP